MSLETWSYKYIRTKISAFCVLLEAVSTHNMVWLRSMIMTSHCNNIRKRRISKDLSSITSQSDEIT